MIERKLESLQKLQNKDINWIVDSILEKKPEYNARASRIVERILVTERIARRLAIEFKNEGDE